MILNLYTDMEDAHTHILSLPDDKDAYFFGVFDGHGGKCASSSDLIIPVCYC